MSYTALYRKFRPAVFDDVKGQDHIVKTLKNQLTHGRIGHAYLFCGTRGTGKTTVAKILARSVNCENPNDGSPCGECPSCKAILAGNSTNVIEIDAASNNGVENVREIISEVAYRPAEGRYKVYIIDEVHMLSTGAFNALLKTLEEPPEYVIFILATTEAHKVPLTILSRCQRYDFHRISIDMIAGRMRELMKEEGVEAEEKALRYVAKAADGSMRDGLSLLDQCISFYMGETLTYDKVLDVLGTVDTEVFASMLNQICAQDVSSCIRTLETLVRRGKEMGQFTADFIWYLRNLLLLKNSDQMDDLLEVSAEMLGEMRRTASTMETGTLMRYIRILSDLAGDLRSASQKRILVEMALIRMCRPQMETDTESILERVRQLESGGGGTSASAAADAGEVRALKERMEKIESALAGGNIPRSGGDGSGTASRNQAQEPRKPVPKAAPEDLKKIRERWRQIASSVGEDDSMFRICLKNGVPKYDIETGDSRLFLEFTNPAAKDYFTLPETIEKLRGMIREASGKDVEVVPVQAGGLRSGSLSEIPVEKLVRSVVRGDIPIEEDTEE